MNNFSLDYSHISFLKEAEADLKSVQVLYKNSNYSQAAYLFQQSIEKSCKFLGLTLNVFDYDRLRTISHHPHKVFKLLFNSDMMLEVYGSAISFDNIDNILRNESDLDDRVKCILWYLQSVTSHIPFIINPDSTAFDTLVVNYQNLQIFKDALSVNGIDNVMDDIALMNYLRNNSKIEHLSRTIINEINDRTICCLNLLFLSFLVWDIESNSRYPDYNKNTTPESLYNKNTIFIENIPLFVKEQNQCIDILYQQFTKKGD